MTWVFSLRWLILLPSVVLLLVPVLGYFWLVSAVTELEENEAQQLQNAADSVAILLAEKRVVRTKLSGLSPSEKEPGVIQIDSVITLDGRKNDWPVHEPISFEVDHLLEITAAYSADTLHYQLSIGADQDYLYLFYEVTDDIVVYREINNPSVHRNDHIRIGMVDPDGSFKRYVIANYQPAEATVHIVSDSGRSLRREKDISGEWRATEAGYNVELKIPRALIGERFASVIADVDDPDRRQVQFVMGGSSTDNQENLGWITFPDNDIQKLIERLPYTRVSLSDMNGRLVAEISQEIPPFDEREGARNFVATGLSRLSQRFESHNLVVAAPISHLGREVGVVTIEKSNIEILKFTWQTVENLLLISGFLMILAVLLVLLSARVLGRRLANVNSGLQAIINSQGRVGGPMPVSNSHDEIGELSRSLNNLLGRIGQYNDYLERMAGRLSHELRTPVSVVRSSLENLNGDELSDEQSVYLERAYSGIGRLTNILGKISEARRLEESLDEEEVVSFNLAEVVKGCIQGYEIAFPDYEFSTSIEADPIQVTGIPELIAQLLDKLINNAVEFSNPQDTIKVRLTGDKKQAVLRVINSGIELPQASDNQLFESMLSVRESDDKHDGDHLGLGLYIARVITEFHGGTIHAANREDTRGVIVTVVIPLMRITSKLR